MLKDIDYYANEVEVNSKISFSLQKKLINWFKKQNILITIEIFKIKRNEFFKLKDCIQDKELLDYIALIKGIEHFYNKEQYLSKKNKSLCLHQIERISNIEISKLKKKRKTPKHDKVLDRWSVVLKLRSENMSWRDIAKYFGTKYRISCTHVLLQNMYKKYEGSSDA